MLWLYLQVIREVYPQINGSEIVLLTDGEDNSAKNCIDEVKQSEAIIHLIALGPSADQAIIEMSAITGEIWPIYISPLIAMHKCKGSQWFLSSSCPVGALQDLETRVKPDLISVHKVLTIQLAGET